MKDKRELLKIIRIINFDIVAQNLVQHCSLHNFGTG